MSRDSLIGKVTNARMIFTWTTPPLQGRCHVVIECDRQGASDALAGDEGDICAGPRTAEAAAGGAQHPFRTIPMDGVPELLARNEHHAARGAA